MLYSLKPSPDTTIRGNKPVGTIAEKDYGAAKDILNSSRLVNLVEEKEVADFARDLEDRIKKAAPAAPAA